MKASGRRGLDMPEEEAVVGRTLLMGTVLGLVCGVVFSALYFGAGQITTPMAYIHDISGAALGFMIAWIVALHKKASAK